MLLTLSIYEIAPISIMQKQLLGNWARLISDSERQFIQRSYDELSTSAYLAPDDRTTIKRLYERAMRHANEMHRNGVA